MREHFDRIPERLRPALIALVAFFIGIIIISIIAISGIFHKNPYGPETKIDNFSHYYKKVPTATRDTIFHSLHNIATLNVENADDAPTSGATIRSNSAEDNYDTSTNIHTGIFTVDIESIQQSFKVWFVWSDNEDNPNLSGYQLSITCLTGAESLYGSTTCHDGSESNPTQNLYAKYPFLSELPLSVSYYGKDFSSYTSYQLSYQTDESDITVTFIITDYTGNSRQAALTKLQELGVNSTTDNIEYRDLSSEESFSRPPDEN